MSLSRFFLLGILLAYLHLGWFGSGAIFLGYIGLSSFEVWSRNYRLRKALNEEFEDGWETYELNPEMELKDKEARMKLDEQHKALLSRLGRLMIRMSVIIGDS
jgi:hypothetical protein